MLTIVRVDGWTILRAFATAIRLTFHNSRQSPNNDDSVIIPHQLIIPHLPLTRGIMDTFPTSPSVVCYH